MSRVFYAHNAECLTVDLEDEHLAHPKIAIAVWTTAGNGLYEDYIVSLHLSDAKKLHMAIGKAIRTGQQARRAHRKAQAEAFKERP